MGPNLTCACHCAHGVIEMHMCGSKGSAAHSLEEKKGVVMQGGWVGDDKHKPRRGEGVVEANSEDLSGILVTLNKSSVVVKLIFFCSLSLTQIPISSLSSSIQATHTFVEKYTSVLELPVPVQAAAEGQASRHWWQKQKER